MSRWTLRLLSIAVFLVIGLALVGCSGGGEEAKGEEEESQAPSQEEVQSALEQAVAAGIPGIALEIQSSEGSEFLTAGSASLEDERPLTPEDSFRIASVTTALTAAVVMELVEEGALSLDDTVEQWTPGLLAEGDSITVRHLLGHTSGLADYTKDENFIEAFVAGEDMPPQRVVSFVSSEPLAFEPGTTYEYSDTDNNVLGIIVEAVARRSYEQELSSRVLDPMELRSTVLPNSPEMPNPHADGYQYDPESEGAEEPENLTIAFDPSAAGASGALVSTPSDLSR
ncbi:MAG TPA: serine hydrolase domain-containing protein, partial [Rubrobacteraceae bacterium]|nr:serine hydrolase domain-containing protein [Rubrobacteraceae bacterium]